MNVIAAHLRLCAVSLFPYLDDWLIRDLLSYRLISHTKYTLQTIQNLGFIPNLKKSDLIPTQQFTFIGMEFLTQQNIVRVPADRVKALILTIKTILSQTQVSAQNFLSILGKLSAAADLILLGRLHLRPLQMCLLSVWKPHILPLDHQVMINSMIKFHLKWWMNTNRFVQGIPIHPPDPKIFLYTDASHYGWGAHLEPMSLSFHGRWLEDQSQLHISMLEIMAICFALIKALKYIHHSCVMIATDNTTVVSYFNKLHAYAFPPSIMIPSVLNKIRQSQCRIVLIAPLWPQQTWFSEVLHLLVSAPVCLSLFPNLLTQAKGKFQHQNLPALNLHAWELSNNQLEIKNFRKKLSPNQDEHQLRKSMMRNGSFIRVGVIEERLIRSRPLLLW